MLPAPVAPGASGIPFGSRLVGAAPPGLLILLDDCPRLVATFCPTCLDKGAMTCALICASSAGLSCTLCQLSCDCSAVVCSAATCFCPSASDKRPSDGGNAC